MVLIDGPLVLRLERCFRRSIVHIQNRYLTETDMTAYMLAQVSEEIHKEHVIISQDDAARMVAYVFEGEDCRGNFDAFERLARQIGFDE